MLLATDGVGCAHKASERAGQTRAWRPRMAALKVVEEDLTSKSSIRPGVVPTCGSAQCSTAKDAKELWLVIPAQLSSLSCPVDQGSNRE